MSIAEAVQRAIVALERPGQWRPRCDVCRGRSTLLVDLDPTCWPLFYCGTLCAAAQHMELATEVIDTYDALRYRTSEMEPDAEPCTLASMLDANIESPEVCEAICTLARGERVEGIVTVERVR